MLSPRWAVPALSTRVAALTAGIHMDDTPNPSALPQSQPAVLRGPSRRPTWVRWQMIVILMGFTGLNHFHRQSLPSVVGAVMRDCGFTQTDMGWVYFAFLLGYVLFMVAGGWL